MKTTIDLPEEILHRAKIVAAQRKTSLKDLVIQGLNYATLHDPGTEESQRRDRARRLLQVLSKSTNISPVGRLNRSELHERHPED